MADILNDQMFLRANVNATPTSRTGIFNTSGPFYIPIFTDGLKAGETITAAPVPTEHKDAGVKYKIMTGRNEAEGTLETPLFPENAGFLLDAILTKTNGIPSYHAIEQYWNATLGAGTSGFGGTGSETSTGRSLLGILFNGFSLAFDRNNIEALRLSTRIFVNQEVPITAAAPTPTFPAQDPYTTGNVYVDLKMAPDTNTLPTYTGDNTDLVTFSLNYSNNLAVSFKSASTTAEKHLAWTRVHRDAPSCELAGSFIMANTDYLRLTRLGALRKAKVRVMGHGTAPSGSTTSLTNLAAAATSITVASATGLAVGDVIILIQSTAGKQAVVTITAIASLVLTVSAMPIAMDGSGGEAIVIKNTAWQLEVPLFDIEANTPPASGGTYKVVAFTGTARLASGGTDLLTATSYDDDNA